MTLGLFYPEDPTGQQGQSNRLVTALWQTPTGGHQRRSSAEPWPIHPTSRNSTSRPLRQDQRAPFLQLFYPGYDGGVRWIWQDPNRLVGVD
jgi:hypothetical protein